MSRTKSIQDTKRHWISPVGKLAIAYLLLLVVLHGVLRGFFANERPTGWFHVVANVWSIPAYFPLGFVVAPLGLSGEDWALKFAICAPIDAYLWAWFWLSLLPRRKHPPQSD